MPAGYRRVVVCGGRRFSDRDFLFLELDDLHALHGFTDLMQGGARGADFLAKLWVATVTGVTLHEMPAMWNIDGRSAGPKRNARMIEWGPDAVIAFEGGLGTADMVAKARAAKIPVIEIIKRGQ